MWAYGPPMEINQRIFKARTDAGLTQDELAQRTGKTRGAVAQWESGDVRPRHSTLALIAKATGKDLVWLESGVDAKSTGLLVVGEVSAGTWREAAAKYQPHGMPVTPDARYPAESQRLYRVSGNSVNRFVKDGEYVHCVDIHLAGLYPEHGDMVVVRKVEHGRTEFTAKSLIRDGTTWILRPESDDPDWQADIRVDGDLAAEVDVTDIIIAKWSPIGRGRA